VLWVGFGLIGHESNTLYVDLDEVFIVSALLMDDEESEIRQKETRVWDQS
jgi:hypothetical protein